MGLITEYLPTLSTYGLLCPTQAITVHCFRFRKDLELDGCCENRWVSEGWLDLMGKFLEIRGLLSIFFHSVCRDWIGLD